MDQRTALHTERLVLRPITRGDIPDLVAGLDDYDVSKWLTVVPFPYTAADGEAFVSYVESCAPLDGYGLTREGGPVMGVVGIDGSLGYWLARAHHGHGYMTEAARALVAHYFAATGADVLKSGYFAGNAASARVLGKLGFRPEGEERVTSRAQGAEVTMKTVTLARADWEVRQGGRQGHGNGH